MILQVIDIKETRLEDSLFRIPKNVPIRQNVSLQEMYSPQQ